MSRLAQLVAQQVRELHEREAAQRAPRKARAKMTDEQANAAEDLDAAKDLTEAFETGDAGVTTATTEETETDMAKKKASSGGKKKAATTGGGKKKAAKSKTPKPETAVEEAPVKTSRARSSETAALSLNGCALKDVRVEPRNSNLTFEFANGEVVRCRPVNFEHDRSGKRERVWIRGAAVEDMSKEIAGWLHRQLVKG